MLITSAANRLDGVHLARGVAAGAVALWLAPGHAVLSELWFPQATVALTCAAFVYVDFVRNGPLAPAVLLALVVNASWVLLHAGELQTLVQHIDVFQTIAFGVAAPAVVGYGAWASWKLTRGTVSELAPERLPVGDAAMVRPGRFASRRYLEVMWWSFSIGAAIFARGLVLVVLSSFQWFLAYSLSKKQPRLLYRLRRRRAMASAVLAEHWQPRDPRTPILLIRSFKDDAADQSVEEDTRRVPIAEDGLIDALWSYAPVIALGNPVEAEPTPGALRTYVRDSRSDDQEWRTAFEALATTAPLIIAFVGPTPSLAWELSRVAELGLMHKLVLLVPAFDDEQTSTRWDVMRANLDRLESLPYAGLRDVDCGGLIAAFPIAEHWVFIRAAERTKSAYQIALRISAQLLRPHDTCHREPNDSQ